jgi:hypothetical protein
LGAGGHAVTAELAGDMLAVDPDLEGRDAGERGAVAAGIAAELDLVEELS